MKTDTAQNSYVSNRGEDVSIQLSDSSQEPLKEVSLYRMLRAIDELSIDLNNESKKIIKCSSQMSLNSEIFWTSPTEILRAIKSSILRRYWDEVPQLLLLLLQHKDQYVPIVQSICGFMARFNPKVQELGLQEKFEILNIRRKEADPAKLKKQE